MERIVVFILLLPMTIYGITFSNGRVLVEISQKTGDIVSVSLGGKKVLKGADELWEFENLKGEKFTASSWKNRVQAIKDDRNTISLSIVNLVLRKRKIGVSVKYFWEDELLIKRVELVNRSGEDLLLRAISKTRIANHIKKNGLYYVPYGQYCVRAGAIKLPTKVENQINNGIKNQMVSVYEPIENVLAASFVYRVNEKFTTVLSGWCVPSYLSSGWEFGSCLYYLKSGEKVSYDIVYYVCSDVPSRLIRRWIKLKEIQKIRADVWKDITLPEWFKQVALVGFVYNPSQIEINHFLPNAKPLADKLPGIWMVIQWGSSHRSFNIKDYIKGYGQPHPPQLEDIRWALRDLPRIRSEMPNVKIGNYRYYWSMDDGSPEGVMHPEWRLLGRDGKPIYAGTVHRYARNPLIPEAVESCVFTTREWYTYVSVDFHYVDGTDGGYPVWVGWRRGVVPQWYDWHRLFLRIYQLVHSDLIKPSVLYCNGSPISCGDAGFIEIGGNNKRVWQGEKGWRGLADRCEMGKLWGPPQGFMCLLFWDRRTDLRYINHILAYGLVPNLSPGGARFTGSEGLDFCLHRVPYIKAAYKIRNSQLVYPDLKPDWRADGGDIEAIMLKVGGTYRLNVINHCVETRSVELSFNPSKIGLDGKKVKLSWYELIPPKRLVGTKSQEVFKFIRSWHEILPSADRFKKEIRINPKLLNVIEISPID